jgi:cyclic beta-1,2-glucan synthetase
VKTRALKQFQLPRKQRAVQSSGNLDEPIRAEVYSAERLERHAEALAAAQRVFVSPHAGREISGRLKANARALAEAHATIAEVARKRRPVGLAAEWLLDNSYVIEQQVKEIVSRFPPHYYRELPKLSNGPLANYPRVYGLVWAYVAHTDSRFDADPFARFVAAYQRVQALTLGELWALPVTLRLLLIENLRRLSAAIVCAQKGRDLADALFEAGSAPGAQTRADSPIPVMPEQALRQAFSFHCVERIRHSDPDCQMPSLAFVQDWLREQGATHDELVRKEHLEQAADNLTVRNLITSFRDISALNWRPFIENISLVHQHLKRNASYLRLDFLSRDRYRHGIEELARYSALSELDLARRAVTRASEASNAPRGRDAPQSDVGFYVIGAGRREFEAAAKFKPPLAQRVKRAYAAHALPAYLLCILAVTLGLLAVPLWAGALPWWQNLILSGLGIFPASDIAIALINPGVVSIFAPRHLPRIQLSSGIPAEFRTVVVVPTMLTNSASVAEQVEQLEVHYLANPLGEAHFGLLSDWRDAGSETLESDASLLQAARVGIETLNQRYGNLPSGAQRFFLLHRHRLWNERERKWMGWERKRGKLHELNRLLLGATDTSFVDVQQFAPQGVRYVLTLDADTRLPIGALSRLVGTAAHPLNRPRFDCSGQVVREGYGVLQPRVTPMLPKGEDRSVFQRLFSGGGGIDPYAGAVSDVYQDLFGEGSFTGKGLYDLHAFEQALANRVPENTLLSHDLLEGSFARCALVSDVELFEDFPSHTEVAASRAHRWTRGDWQLLPWIFGRRGAGLPALARWKMLDNLRRSLSAPASLLTLLATWCIPGSPHPWWLALVVGALAFPALLALINALVSRSSGTAKSRIRRIGADAALGFAQGFLSLTLLAHHAWLVTDAVGRASFRMSVTRRGLLEWVTAAQAKAAADLSFRNFLWPLRSSTIVVIGASALIMDVNPQGLRIAAPLLVLWWLAPVFARAVSLPPSAPRNALPSAAELARLRLVGRRTWRYFSAFVTDDENALPPDNFQEHPAPVVAQRSSPTNFGLYLLATVAARDFGWLGTRDAVDRLHATMKTLGRLEQAHGHFYNWYDTRSLQPLEPRYLSLVDSGNLAAHLLVLAQSCEEMLTGSCGGAAALAGVTDTLYALRESIASEGDEHARNPALCGIEQSSNDLSTLLLSATASLAERAPPWLAIERCTEQLLHRVQSYAVEREEADSPLLDWANQLHFDVLSHLRDIRALTPWTIDPFFSCLHEFDPQSNEIWQALRRELASGVALKDLPERCRRSAQRVIALKARLGSSDQAELNEFLEGAASALPDCAATAQQLCAVLQTLAADARALVLKMDFRYLFDFKRRLFPIGLRAAEAAFDASYYDLLASEARLSSYVAIAKRDVPASHWFQLGREVTEVKGAPVLLSWSGSMFEYLMPSLVLYTRYGSLLDVACRGAIQRQIEYGAERRVPWGVSESAYNSRDRAHTYQYSDFGVPGLGLKRGLEQNIVIAPYATALAAMYRFRPALRNYERLEKLGGRGRYGYYEALDFTRSRLPEGSAVAPVRAYMAHHQGMTVVALANVVFDGVMRHRFHREPSIRAAELLLEERPPREVPARQPGAADIVANHATESGVDSARHFHSPHSARPMTHLLSNGRYTVMLTAAGAGYSVFRNNAVTRWREDPARDCCGSYVYLRDCESAQVWSAALQPSLVEADSYAVLFQEDRARITRRDGSLESDLEVLVSPEDDAEIRRLTLSNAGPLVRIIELTSYAEVVLAPHSADLAHPAFSNLSVHTEYVGSMRGLLATRRPRSPSDPPIWVAHVASYLGSQIAPIQYETDRSRFIGRGRSVQSPEAMSDGRALSNSVGAVLDPCLSLRVRVRIEPGASVRMAFTTLIAASREAAVNLADKYQDLATFERASTLAWAEAQMRLQHLQIDAGQAQLFQYLAGCLIYRTPALRPGSEVLRCNIPNQGALWPHRISGDLPVVLLRVASTEDRHLIVELLQAHDYLQSKRFAVDLVILNEEPASYMPPTQALLESLMRARDRFEEPDATGPRGCIFVLHAGQLASEDRTLLQAVARAILVAGQGSLEQQLARLASAAS